MAEVQIDDDTITIRLSPLEKIGALRGDVEIPRDQLTWVERADPVRRMIRGFRSPGTGVPGAISLGTWRTRAATDFVAVYGRGPGYVLHLDGHRYDRIVVSADADDALDALV